LQLPPLDVNCGKPQGTLVSDLTSEIITETASLLEGCPPLSKDNPSHLAGSSLTLSSDHPTDFVPTGNIGGRQKGQLMQQRNAKKWKLEASNE
jgi:hypothetical protein